MSTTEWVLAGIGASLAAYLLFILALVATGRRSDARAVGGFVPDCLLLVRRLLSDPRVPRQRKLLLWGLLLYLASPVDLVPDFIPVAGQLDDAVFVALVLRLLVRGGRDLVAEHWPGPDSSRDVVLRLAR